MILLSLALATLTTTAELNALSHDAFASQQPFALTGTVSSVLFGNHFVVADATGRTHVRNLSGTAPGCGDRVALLGRTECDVYRQEQSVATNVTVLGPGPRDEPRLATVAGIARGDFDYANVCVEGRVTDVLPDDIDPSWSYLVLADGGADTFVTIPDRMADFTRLARARVSIVGTVIPNHCGARRFVGSHVQTDGADAVTVLLPTEQSDAEAPPLARVNHLGPNEVVHLGRRVIDGFVLAAWGGGSFLVRSEDHDVHRVDLASSDGALPACGSFVRATGLPETDLYRINLSRATWRPLDATVPKPLLPPEKNPLRWRVARRHQHFHGNTVNVTGRVLADPDARSHWRAIVQCEGERIGVDISNLTELEGRLAVGNVITVTGCGLIETANWRPGTPFPLQQESVVIVRAPDDLRVISRPSWWTPERLFAVIGALVGLLIAICIWNRFLNRLVERRGRQLVREELAHNAAELRTAERTRLAAEMHDSLSQSLTGISCQIDALESARVKRPDRIAHHLELARRMLNSCRMQLRNCLWDLRSDMLNEPDAVTAIRKTIQPHADVAEVAIDFPIRRSAFSDTIFHEVLSILRELVANAVRHGHAAHIALAARREADGLVITVTDDGCGFDPDRRPGAAEGHFGLTGVAERLERLDGELTVRSAPGTGATFTLKLKELS